MFRDHLDAAPVLAVPAFTPPPQAVTLTVIDGGRKGPPAKAPLTAAKAAREFAHWLRSIEEDRQDQYTDRQLAVRYAEFCEVTDDRLPTPENSMRDVLKSLPGICREIIDARGPDGKRRRSALWTISVVRARQRRAA